jgi:hypothetical protein
MSGTIERGSTRTARAEGSGPVADPRVLRVGFWAAVLALLGAFGYVLSVPLQVLGVLDYTQDAVLAFGASLVIAVPFVLTMLALHDTVARESRFWTQAAIAFAAIYAAYNTLNYVVQLTIVLPAGYTWTFDDQGGTIGPLSVLNQTPHSLFWVIDGLGYVFLNLATLFAAGALRRRGPERWLRVAFLTNAAITPLFALAYFFPIYSVPLLMLGGGPWAITVPACLALLALHFRRRLAEARGTGADEPKPVTRDPGSSPGVQPVVSVGP